MYKYTTKKSGNFQLYIPITVEKSHKDICAKRIAAGLIVGFAVLTAAFVAYANIAA